MILLQIKFLLIYMTGPQQAQAEVNVFDGSYSTTHDDIVVTRDRRDFRLRRNYSSRNITPSYFGLGWCSWLDAKLEIKDDQQIHYFDCEKNLPIVFIKNTSQNMVYEPRNKKVAYKLMWLKSLNEFRLINPHAGLVIHFASNGKLLKLTGRKILSLGMLYSENGKLNGFTVGADLRFRIQLNLYQQITLITGEKTRYQYTYNNSLLVRVEPVASQIDQANRYIYSYDNYKNLSRWTNQLTGDSEKISYEGEYDRVLGIENRNGCVETVQYIEVKKTTDYKTKIKKSCGGQTIRELEFIFKFKITTGESILLDTVTLIEKKSQSRQFLDRIQPRRQADIGGKHVIFKADES